MSWWPVVFWLLLIPLLAVEVFIFVRTKRLFWLFYALSIFVYVVAVSYTLDVFAASRNAIILTLVGSAVVMALIGRHLGRKTVKKRQVSRPTFYTAIALFAILLIFFVISVVFGKAEETVTPVTSIQESQLLVQVDLNDPRRIEGGSGIVVLQRHVTNGFFLPVPVNEKTYRFCIDFAQGQQELFSREAIVPHQEVAPFSTRTIDVRVTPFQYGEHEAFSTNELLVYEVEDEAYRWVPCEDIPSGPVYRIPVV